MHSGRPPDAPSRSIPPALSPPSGMLESLRSRSGIPLGSEPVRTDRAGRSADPPRHRQRYDRRSDASSAWATHSSRPARESIRGEHFLSLGWPHLDHGRPAATRGSLLARRAADARGVSSRTKRARTSPGRRAQQPARHASGPDLAPARVPRSGRRARCATGFARCQTPCAVGPALSRATESIYPGSDSLEATLEIQEGLPEYTGQRLAMQLTGEGPRRVAQYVRDYERNTPTFVRAFAYGTGPALGVLLDQFSRGWRDSVRTKRELGALLAQSIDFRAPAGNALSAAARARAKDYGWDEIDRAEAARDSARAPAMRDYRSRLQDGPTITLRQSMDSLSWSFDPTELVGFDLTSAVYPSGNFSAPWGKLTIERGGVLVANDFSRIRIGAPPNSDRLRSADDHRRWLDARAQPGMVARAGCFTSGQLHRCATLADNRPPEGPPGNPAGLCGVRIRRSVPNRL